MNQLQEYETISLKPIQEKLKRNIPSSLVSIVITNQSLDAVKWLPLDTKKINIDEQDFPMDELIALIEEHYISIQYLTEAKVFLGITDNRGSFFIYQEMSLCESIN